MRLFRLGCVLAAFALLAGCGGKAAPKSTPTPTIAPVTTPAPKPKAKATPTPTPLSSADDLTACAQLEQAVQAVSALVGHTTEDITKATRPDELAQKTKTAQNSLLDSAKLIALVEPPKPLVVTQRNLEAALRMFAADFGRASASATKGDVASAAQQTVDEKALRGMQIAVRHIDQLCGA